MLSPSKPYAQTEQLPGSSSVLIIGDAFPAIVDALEEYLSASSDHIYTTYTRDRRVHYLIVFDEPNNIQTYLSALEPGGKALHVISRKGYAQNHLAISTFYLSPKKEYPPKKLIRLLISELSHAKPHTPPTDDHKKLKSKASGHAIQSWQRAKKPFVIILGIMLLLLAPTIISASAGSLAAYHLSESMQTSRSIEDRTASAEHAVTASHVATTAYKAIHPVVQLFAPDTDHIIVSHGDIITGTAQTAVVALKHYPVFESVMTTLTSKNPNRIKSDAQKLKDTLQAIQATIEPVSSTITQLEPYADHTLVAPVWEYYAQLQDASRSLSSAYSVIDYLPDILAVTTRKTYAVLLQNNFELRPTGGFIGSYALVTMENGTVKDVSIEDVYEADGQLRGQVEPPEPIAQYLNQPNWFLRDSNWNPDFSLSAKQAEWFLDKELNTHVDGVVAIDLYTLKYILNALDGVYVPNYQATVTADDFFYKLQHDNHKEFFPGSDKKKNLITDLTNALAIDLASRDMLTLLKVGQAIEQSLHEKHILVYHHDTTTQQLFESLGWAGRIVSPPADTVTGDTTKVSDYTMVVDANVGVNKVNASVKRELYSTIETLPSFIEHELVVYYKNESSGADDTLYNGIYKNYVRIIVPLEAEIISVTNAQGEDLLQQAHIETLQDKKTLGIYREIAPRTDEKIVLRYQLPKPEGSFTYELMTQKQPGTDADPRVIRLGTRAQQEFKRKSFDELPYLTHLSTDHLIAIDF